VRGREVRPRRAREAFWRWEQALARWTSDIVVGWSGCLGGSVARRPVDWRAAGLDGDWGMIGRAERRVEVGGRSGIDLSAEMGRAAILLARDKVEFAKLQSKRTWDEDSVV